MSESPYITAEEILSSDGRFKARAKAASAEVRNAAEVLATRLNALFEHYVRDYTTRPLITSGYRTPAANKAAGGAAKSAHLEGRACDFADSDGAFAKWCSSHLWVLEESNLWMESPLHTVGWAHLQSRPASERVFLP